MTAREIVRELEMDGDKRDTPRLFFDELEDQINNAIFAAVAEERKACAKILLRVYSAWVEGGYSPGEAFESARDKILHGARSNASTRSSEPEEK